MFEPTLMPGGVLDALLATRRDGHGMPRGFYQTDALYATEMHKIWHAGWAMKELGWA